jgi:hypothetical protein
MAIVEGVYRGLGVIAPINQRLSRLRLNAIPANIVLMIGLGAVTAVSWNSVARVLASRKTPEPQTVDTLVAKTRFAQGYVAAQGKLMPDGRLTLEGSSGNLQLADYTWVPLVDAASGDAILVQFDATHALPANGADVTVEGMLRPMNSSVARRLKETKFVHAGIRIAGRFMLIAGRQPGWLEGPLITGILFGAIVLGLLWSTIRRNVVFMPAEPALSSGRTELLEPTCAAPLLVSGRLALDAKTRRFFTNMPATWHRGENGDVALVSHITRTSTFYGVKTHEHTGLWILAMRPGSITEAQSGYVFWGLQKMRATRFRYINAMTGASEQAVVASPGALATAQDKWPQRAEAEMS